MQIKIAMRGYNASVLIAASLLLQGAVDAMIFDPLKALLSPPSRVIRHRNGSPRAQGTKDCLTVLDFAGLVSRHNYAAEEHNVTTSDGYNLILHRISGSPLSPPGKKKPIVFVQHGIMASSDSWILRGPGKDLAFLLADAGYDVWLGNFRGNTYSRSHVMLSPEDPKFWEYSYHEMGLYDLPAMVDYSLEKTGQKSVFYIGHSMATTASYVLLSMRAEYNKRFRLVISLAPIAYWTHEYEGIQKLMVLFGKLIENYFRSIGLFELLPQSSFYTNLANALCNDRAVTQQACSIAFSTPSGYDLVQFNASFIPYFMNYYPAGISLQTLSHYHQNMVSRKFQQYDFGLERNFGRYQQAEAPNYDLSKITAPIALFYGKNDNLAQAKDVMALKKKLPNIITSVAVCYEQFNHIDFLWARDSKSLIYDDLIDLIDRFS